MLVLQALPKDVSMDQLPLGSNTMLVPQVDYNVSSRAVLLHACMRIIVTEAGLVLYYTCLGSDQPLAGHGMGKCMQVMYAAVGSSRNAGTCTFPTEFAAFQRLRQEAAEPGSSS